MWFGNLWQEAPGIQTREFLPLFFTSLTRQHQQKSRYFFIKICPVQELRPKPLNFFFSVAADLMCLIAATLKGLLPICCSQYKWKCFLALKTYASKAEPSTAAAADITDEKSQHMSHDWELFCVNQVFFALLVLAVAGRTFSKLTMSTGCSSC